MPTCKSASSVSKRTRKTGGCVELRCAFAESVLTAQIKFINLQKMHSSTVSSMQLEMDNLRSERDKTLVAIRELEMGNDELESKHR